MCLMKQNPTFKKVYFFFQMYFSKCNEASKSKK